MLEPGNGVTPELGEIDFQYHDADSFQVELAELYSYSEEPEFHSGPEKLRYFVGSDRWGVAVSYESSGSQQARQRVSAVRRLLEAAESANTQLRADAIGALLYLAQGAWDEPDVRKLLPDHRQAQVLNNIRENCILLYQQGAWPLLLQLLRFEAELQPSTTPTTLTLADSRRTREILSVLCTMAEVFRNIGSDATESERALKRSFSDEVSQVSSDGGGLLAVSLLQMVTAFCNGSANQLPLKKLLLLLWKSLLLSLGGIEDLKRIKAEARNMEGLPAAPPDTTDVVRTMRPASPPASLVDMIEVQQQQQQQQQQQRKSSRNQFKRQSFVKQSSMDDQETANGAANEVGGASVVMRLVGNADDQSKQANIDPTELPPDAVDPDEAAAAAEEAIVGESQLAHSEPQDTELNSSIVHSMAIGDSKKPQSSPEERRGLPWEPKTALRDIDNFLAQARMKFIGFQLPNDTTTLAGLPEPIHQGLYVLKKHMYTPLSEVQIMREVQIERYPLTHQIELPDTATERLYQALLPQMPQHMISLLKILLAAAPTSKAKTESAVNILADLLPTADATFDGSSISAHSTLLTIDINRHKEILVKAISAILLLVIKHFKISHCLQFEYMAQQLMFANCIPLVLKFFNQNVVSYAAARHTLPSFEVPMIFLQPPGEVTPDTLKSVSEASSATYCWRNVFACINLLRILNKLTKNKHSRVMMLVVFKSAPILKRVLKVRQAMLQLYALKLLKMQTKYLGRQWRKTNMKTMSAIYHKVRHRLGDDWAYGSDLDARPWDFQAEEFSLQAFINDFHRRRYERAPPGTVNMAGYASGSSAGASSSFNHSGQTPSDFDPLLDLEPVDNCFLSVLGRQFELLPDFKENYRYWLKCQVYDTAIEWEKLLESPKL